MSEKNQHLQDLDQSYWAIVKRQFKKNRLAVWSLRVVYVIVFIGLFANFIANDKPYYCKYNGNTYFPVFKEVAVNLGIGSWPTELVTADWKKLELENDIWPLVPYSSKEFDRYNVQHKSPFGEQFRLRNWRWRHWMGTDEIGRDVLAGMIYGTRIAMLVGVVSMSIATFIGIIMGAFAGYFGDERLKVSLIRLVLNLVFIYPAFFYSFGVRSDILVLSFGDSLFSFLWHLLVSIIIFAAIMSVPNLISKPLKNVSFLSRRVNIPVDIIISRAIEIIISIPSLLLILSIVAIAKPSIMIVMVVIGFTSWTGIARFARGELLRVRSLEYITAAQSLGFSEFRTIFKHALPNALTSVLISVAFGVAGAILTESFLSFLGIGVQADVITWGKLLNFSRSTPEAWWLAIFPGFAIFITVTIFNLLGEGLNDALDPRLK